MLEDSEDLTNDLSGVMKLQRRLSMMERDLGAIKAKLESLEAEAAEIEKEKPEEAMAIRVGNVLASFWWAIRDIINLCSVIAKSGFA